MIKLRSEDDNKVAFLRHGRHHTNARPVKAVKRKQTLALQVAESVWQLNPLLSIWATKIRALLVGFNLLMLASCFVHAGFWTFYFPNFLKPNGYKEITGMIEAVQADMNATIDNFADIQYFWTLMQQYDNLNADTIYPEESACSEVFPLFRDMAIEYAQIDYELYMKPMQLYHEQLSEMRANWYPEGAKSRYPK